MENLIELKAYTKDKTIVQHAIGICAVMQLLQHLYNSKTDKRFEKNKWIVDQHNNEIRIKDDTYTYVFENVPILWDSSLSISVLHKQIYNQIKEELKGGE